MSNDRKHNIVNSIVATSQDNTSGLIMSRESIEKAVIECDEYIQEIKFIPEYAVNDIMIKYESDEGYLTKVSDILFAFKKYPNEIISDNKDIVEYVNSYKEN